MIKQREIPIGEEDEVQRLRRVRSEMQDEFKTLDAYLAEMARLDRLHWARGGKRPRLPMDSHSMGRAVRVTKAQPPAAKSAVARKKSGAAR